MTDIPSGRWLTLTEAAHHLGISERTIRRRIDANQYHTDRSTGRLLVWVPDVAPDTGSQAGTTANRDAGADIELAALRAEIRRLTDLLARADEEKNRLWAALATAMQNEQRLIEASSQQPAAAEPGPDRTRRPWWKFWG